jgi:hypothetical protein
MGISAALSWTECFTVYALNTVNDRPVGIALGYGLDDRGFESWQGLGIFLFTTASKTAIYCEHQLLFNTNTPLSESYKKNYLTASFFLKAVSSTLTKRSRILLENLTVTQLVKKFPTFYGVRRFPGEYNTSIPPTSFNINFNIILLLYPRLLSGLVPSGIHILHNIWWYSAGLRAG